MHISIETALSIGWIFLEICLFLLLFLLIPLHFYSYLLSLLRCVLWLELRPTSVQFSCSVVSDSLRPQGLQHTRLPCPLPTPRACSNSCPLSWWCHPTISSSVIPFSSCLSVFPSIRVFSNESVLRIRWPKYAFGISQLKTQKSSVYTLIFHQSPWFADLSQVRILYREIVISKRKGNFAG